MDNKRGNSDKDKILEEILDKVSRESERKPVSRTQYSSGRSSVRNNSNQHVPRKTMNPAARSTSSNTGFAVSRTSDNKTGTVSRNTGYVNKNTSALKNNTGSGYQEYTINIKRKNMTDTGNEQAVRNTGIHSTNSASAAEHNVRKAPVSYEQSAKSRKVQTASPEREKAENIRRKNKKRSGRLPIVLILTTLIVTVAVSLSVLIIAVGRDMLAIGKDEALKMVTISEGDDAKKVAQILYDEDIIKIPKAFEVVCKMSDADTNFIPGEYELSPSDAYETIITKLTTDMSEYKETVDITFVEGISIYEAAQQLEEEGVCEAERFLYYFNAGGYGFEFENRLPSNTTSKFYKMEGYLFPDTYRFYADSDPESVCMKIYQNFENKMTDEYYAQMDKKGMTLDEVITLASIVQAEAPTAESMKKVASVFENRLADPDNFPKLESDPTTYYVDEIIRPNIEIPSDVIFEAYDTYKSNGLPPGAIGNPGLDAIEAVLYPDDTDYYFFCANIDTKEIYYAKTNEEHEENMELIGQQYEDAENNYDDEDE
ncbi:endolytic transglycosylase MltG [Porcipelethomonas sp.]|uniref:endolytic transglycosylase MltG n=1 Tax=Porcipelethomonas sp. TaxID=2981675 RepID=UPI003EF2DDF6